MNFRSAALGIVCGVAALVCAAPAASGLAQSPGEGLPDGRAYEMVTPPEKNAALIGVGLLVQPPIVANDGSRLIMTAIQCFAGAESCTGSRQNSGEPFLFSRTTAGWITTPFAPPATRFVANTMWLANANTAMALFSMPTPPALEDDFYVRTPNGEFVDLGPATPPAEGPDLSAFKAGQKAATSDFSRLVFRAKAPWVSPEAGPQLYELSQTGSPTMPVAVGVTGGPGSKSLVSKCETSFSGNRSVPGEVSEDGETVFFTAMFCPAGGTGENAGVEVPADTLYARVGQARTVKISERSPTACTTVACQSSTPQRARFVGASNDGSKAFFLSNQQLMDSAGKEGNLYEYDKADEDLIDVSAGAGTEAPAVQGVVAISTDGSHVYFVARSELTDRPNRHGDTAKSGADNLYVFARDAGHPGGQLDFIARLPESDASLWETSEDQGTANVTPDGRYLVFESHADLTSDDVRTDDAVQIFRYDAETGTMERISIGKHGFDDNGNAGAGNAHIVPSREGGPHNHAGAARSDPTMSNDGSYVFFESPIALTPHAVNNVQIGTLGGGPVYAENIYEWHDGEVSLISDGQDAKELANESAVKLIGSDTSGANVFFRTADALLPRQDTDTQIDYYDARICTVEDPCIPQPPPPPSLCLGEACHGLPAATPGEPSGGSATLSGHGNLAAPGGESKRHRKHKKQDRCTRGKQRRHGRCLKHRAKRGKRGRR